MSFTLTERLLILIVQILVRDSPYWKSHLNSVLSGRVSDPK